MREHLPLPTVFDYWTIRLLDYQTIRLVVLDWTSRLLVDYSFYRTMRLFDSLFLTPLGGGGNPVRGGTPLGGGTPLAVVF